MAGAVAVDVQISHWLFVCTVLLALFIALAKRRHELVLLADDATSHRRILSEYSPYLLDQMISVVTASTLLAYIFYTISPETEARFGTSWLWLTIPFPLYGIFRYLYLVHRREGGGNPADLRDNVAGDRLGELPDFFDSRFDSHFDAMAAPASLRDTNSESRYGASFPTSVSSRARRLPRLVHT